MAENNHKKILTLSTHDITGGAGRAAYRVYLGTKEYIDNSYLVSIKASNDDSVLQASSLINTRTPINRIKYLIYKQKAKQQAVRWNHYPDREKIYFSDLNYAFLPNILKKIDFDLIHLNWINHYFINLHEIAKAKKPIVWTFHDNWAFTGICHYLFDCTKYKTQCQCCPLLQSSDKKDLSNTIWKEKNKLYSKMQINIVCPSHWLADQAKASKLMGHFPIHVIPNCIETNIYKPIEQSPLFQRLGLNKNKVYILYGAMNATADKRKGFLELRQALDTIKSELNNKNVELLVFGSNEPLENLNSTIPIHSFGMIHDNNILISLYNIADVMIVPSLSENLSCTIMESLSCGTPVTAFNIGGNSDMIDHKKNGYLAQEENTADLGQGILWCLSKNRDHSLSVAARKKVLDNYTIDVVSKQYVNLYNNILKEQV